jgi:hypothetical protein
MSLRKEKAMRSSQTPRRLAVPKNGECFAAELHDHAANSKALARLARNARP